MDTWSVMDMVIETCVIWIHTLMGKDMDTWVTWTQTIRDKGK